jgi:ferredoxin
MQITLNYCPFCGEKYDEDSYIISTEREEFWGAPCYRDVIDRVKCFSCGEEL